MIIEVVYLGGNTVGVDASKAFAIFHRSKHTTAVERGQVAGVYVVP